MAPLYLPSLYRKPFAAEQGEVVRREVAEFDHREHPRELALTARLELGPTRHLVREFISCRQLEQLSNSLDPFANRV